MEYADYFEVLEKQFIVNFSLALLVTGLFLYYGIPSIINSFKIRDAFSILCAMLATVLLAIPTIMCIRYSLDIPNIKAKKYIIATGMAISEYPYEDRADPKRKISFLKDNGEEISISIDYCGAIYYGDRFEVIYLPISKLAVIVQKLD